MSQQSQKDIERESAKKQRDDYVRALKEELEQVTRAGKEERAEAVKAELSRMQKADSRTPAPKAETRG